MVKESSIGRGTTPTNTFDVQIDLTEASAIFISYAQEDKVVVEKSLEDITVTETSLAVTLTQEDTLGFVAGKPVEIQVRVKLGDRALKSDIIRTTVTKVLKEGVI